MRLTELQKGRIEAGCDEAGRGCLAGPVVAAAVILPSGFQHELLNDSKMLSEEEREEVRIFIEKNALCYAVGLATNQEIDQINILQASFLAMHRALDQLQMRPEFILVDGNRFNPYGSIPHSCEIKGDSRFGCIAAASILAKTHRDRMMRELDREFPAYSWRSNKGYPTPAHREAIRQRGPTDYHRKSFALLPRQLEITFD